MLAAGDHANIMSRKRQFDREIATDSAGTEDTDLHRTAHVNLDTLAWYTGRLAMGVSHIGPNPASTALSSGTITRFLPLRSAAAVGSS